MNKSTGLSIYVHPAQHQPNEPYARQNAFCWDCTAQAQQHGTNTTQAAIAVHFLHGRVGGNFKEFRSQYTLHNHAS